MVLRIVRKACGAQVGGRSLWSSEEWGRSLWSSGSWEEPVFPLEPKIMSNNGKLFKEVG